MLLDDISGDSSGEDDSDDDDNTLSQTDDVLNKENIPLIL